ncbi:uncharacterized protein [Macrobrachium rosenbergii]|uniref:uncharacterized protein n=1 Tax=Macrobrachium rosenbergii TaxID=79674 RepID=UPI0034D7331B
MATLHHSPIQPSPHQLFVMNSCLPHSPTASEEPPPGGYESAEESGCEGDDVLDEEELGFLGGHECYRNFTYPDLSSSPPTPPIIRQRSHTYCGPELPRLPFLAKNTVERCHSNDALWSRTSERRPPSQCSNSEDLYEPRSSISSTSSSTMRRKSLSRCLPEEDEQNMKGCTGIRRALSSLSLRLLQGEKERPVQRILRPPRRRQTVRGLSGLPIESVNQWNSTATMSG